MEMWMNCKEEEDLLFKNIHNDMYACEWGSGQSTLAIAKRVRELVSIEHDPVYYKQTNDLLNFNNISNVNLIYMPPSSLPPGELDGDYLDFARYIYAGYKSSKSEKFDVVYIDGRARVACAAMATYMLKDGGCIFMHDYKHPKEQYRRREYEVVESFLTHVDQAFAMGKFTVKI